MAVSQAQAVGATATIDRGERRNALIGIALMVTAVLMFVIMDTIGKSLTQSLPVQQVVWGRYIFHFLLTAALLPFIGRRSLLATRRPLIQLGRGLLLAIATLCMFTAFSFVPLADAYVISFIAPLLVTALSVPLLAERVGWRRWTAVAVGFAGVLIVIRPGLVAVHWALLMPLITAANFALYQILTRKLSAEPGEYPVAMLFYVALVGTVVTSLIVPFYWTPLGVDEWLWMVAMGALGAAGHLILIRALTIAPASLLSPFIYTQIVWALITGWFVFGDRPDLWTLAGGTVIVGSGLFVFWREARLQRS
ncbi:MAG TPA: DMT family transporter [Geminicoccaceae bacterium]